MRSVRPWASWSWLAVVAAAGVAAGAVVVFLVQSAPGAGEQPSMGRAGAAGAASGDDEGGRLDGDSGRPRRDRAAVDEPAASEASPGAPTTKALPVPIADAGLALAWTPGGLPDGFGEALGRIGNVGELTVVRADLVELASSRDSAGAPVDELEPGWVIPLDAVAIDPDTYDAFVPKSALQAIGDLGPGEALLTRTGAALRGLDPGAVLVLAGGLELRVAGILDDELLGGAEVAVSVATGEQAGVVTPRYVLMTYTDERASIEEAVRGLAPDRPVRIRVPGETPVLRHGDAVLTQAQIKERFGEFSYRRAGGALEQDPSWVEEHLVTAEVPLLGRVRCHRSLLPALRGALAELEREGLGWLVDPDGYAGCHAARLVASQQSVSRHAWGVAVDLNVDKNPAGTGSAQDPRLVEVMERWGFAWGGPWLVPDPGHFEHVQAPDLPTPDAASGHAEPR